MPVQKPGRSEQDVGTPVWLLRLVERSFGKISLDPAASHRYHACERYCTKDIDGLEQPWHGLLPGTIVWVNPPYTKIRPWVKKAEETAYFWSQVVAMLVPAAVGSNWWAAHVHQKAAVYFLRPRLKFIGHDQGYPKDLALLVYGAGPPVYRCIRVTEEDEQIQENSPGDPATIN
jgi:phage N-6-adenine-methyltransferase